MKIRIKGNSIRMRLSKTEVNIFSQTGMMEETTFIGDAVFCYRLCKKADGNALSAIFENNTITVYMPDADAQEWTNTEKVGVENNLPLANGSQLFLLVEKDFKCLEDAREDQSDMFINPNKTC